MAREILVLRNSDIRNNKHLRQLLTNFKIDGCPEAFLVPFNIDRKTPFINLDSPRVVYVVTYNSRLDRIDGLLAIRKTYDDDSMTISHLCARKNTRGNGKVLMEFTYQFLLKNKLPATIHLTSVSSAIGFYQKMGFVVVRHHEGGTDMVRY